MESSASASPQLRPLSFGEVLDVAINVVLKNLKTLVAAVAVVIVPVQVLTILVQLSLVPDSFDPQAGSEAQVEAADGAAVAGGFVLAALFAFVGTVLATGACFKAIADAYLGERPSWRESLRYALRRLRSLVWVAILYGLIPTLALFLLIVPGVYLWVAWAVATPALLLEGTRGTKALGRSHRLVRGRWWASFGILLIGFLIAAVIEIAVGFPLGFAAGFGAPESFVANIVATGVAGALAALLATPLQAAFVSILYFDLRVRKEGFDLRLLAERIGAEPERAGSGSPYIKPAYAAAGEWTPPAHGEDDPSRPRG